VYYPVSVPPRVDAVPCEVLARDVRLEGIRRAILEGAGLTELGDQIGRSSSSAPVSIPLGPLGLRRGETYAKRHGKLKRSG
jgi:hypothetical protein